MALAKLTPAVLNKKNSNTGEQRIDILERAIKEGTVLALVDGSEVTLDKSEENLAGCEQFRKENKAFQLTAGSRAISSSDIGKSALFGGGGGGAGGSGVPWNTGGNGGNALANSITGSSVNYSGGGGGGPSGSTRPSPGGGQGGFQNTNGNAGTVIVAYPNS